MLCYFVSNENGNENIIADVREKAQAKSTIHDSLVIARSICLTPNLFIEAPIGDNKKHLCAADLLLMSGTLLTFVKRHV